MQATWMQTNPPPQDNANIINKTLVYNKCTESEAVKELICTANDQNSIITKLYQCVNGTEIHIDQCNIYHSTHIGRASANCSVTVEVENTSYIYYCTEARLGEPMGQLSVHYSISVIHSKSCCGTSLYTVDTLGQLEEAPD